MAKKETTPKPTDAEQVDLWMSNSAHPLKKGIEVIRTLIKKADKRIQERVKWNAPSYYYIDDIVTFGPERKGKILLVFHHPSVVKITSQLLEGDYKDRRLVYFESEKEIQSNKKELVRIVKEIVHEIEKKDLKK